MSLYIPKQYRAKLVPEVMEQAIKMIKDRDGMADIMQSVLLKDPETKGWTAWREAPKQKVSLQNELMAETNLTLTFGNDSVAELLMFDLCSLQKGIHCGGALIFNLVSSYCQLLSRKLREKESMMELE